MVQGGVHCGYNIRLIKPGAGKLFAKDLESNSLAKNLACPCSTKIVIDHMWK